MNKKKWILAGIMLLVGVPMVLIGYEMDKSGSTSQSMGIFIIGLLICATAIAGTLKAIGQSIQNWFNK